MDEPVLRVWMQDSVAPAPHYDERPPGRARPAAARARCVAAPVSLPEECPGVEHEPLRPIPFKRTTEHDLVTNERTYMLTSDGGDFEDHSHAYIEAIDITLGYSITKRHRIRPSDPLSARTEIVQWVELERQGWKVRIDCETCTRAARDHLHFTGRVVARQNDELVFERDWDEMISREGTG